MLLFLSLWTTRCQNDLSPGVPAKDVATNGPQLAPFQREEPERSTNFDEIIKIDIHSILWIFSISRSQIAFRREENERTSQSRRRSNLETMAWKWELTKQYVVRRFGRWKKPWIRHAMKWALFHISATKSPGPQKAKTILALLAVGYIAFQSIKKLPLISLSFPGVLRWRCPSVVGYVPLGKTRGKGMKAIQLGDTFRRTTERTWGLKSHFGQPGRNGLSSHSTPFNTAAVLINEHIYAPLGSLPLRLI